MKKEKLSQKDKISDHHKIDRKLPLYSDQGGTQ